MVKDTSGAGQAFWIVKVPLSSQGDDHSFAEAVVRAADLGLHRDRVEQHLALVAPVAVALLVRIALLF